MAVMAEQSHPGFSGSTSRWPALVRERATDSGPLLGPGSPIDTPEAEVYQLGELCAEAYMQSEALHFRALLLLAEFHRLEGWKSTSFPSTAEWLAWRVGIKLGPARERVRTATALMKLPRTAQAMQNGELSFAKVRALTRVATPENEETNCNQDANAGCSDGECLPNTGLDNGEPCAEDFQCTSGHCGDGFCCGAGECCGGSSDDCDESLCVARFCDGSFQCVYTNLLCATEDPDDGLTCTGSAH